MLEVFVKYLCFVMMAIVGCIIIKRVLNYQFPVLNYKNVSKLLILLIIPALLYNSQYNSINTMVVFGLNILMYKKFFNISIIESILLCGYLMILSFVADLLTILVLSPIINLEMIRNSWYILIIANLITCIIMTIPTMFNFMCTATFKIIDRISKNKYATVAMFIILFIIVLSIVDKSLYHKFILNKNIISDLLIILIFVTLLVIYIREKDGYNKLSQEYDVMFNYIHNFEEWIEKEQFNRHEYKNQLAVLRCLSTEKKVKEKIDEILEDNINLEGKVVHELKLLPKGGIKGLMYYKSAIAQKNKIDLTINVSIDSHSLLSKLTDQEIKTICKLIGVYYDNAIEAAIETRKKIILIEIYELKDKVSFVFSNTFKKYNNFDDRNKKGVSSKGEGHGNGLYFASKILEQNSWLESKQDIIDKYYIQQIIIHKKEKTSK